MTKRREKPENPEAFNEKVKDITLMERAGAMTGETLFYLAVAVLEYTNCLRTGDQRSTCLRKAKRSIGHIGFAIFMKGNKMTMDLAQIMTRGKINLKPTYWSYGMMAQTVFQDMYYHPLTQELLTILMKETRN